jgi:3-dehydroquinate synthase
MKKIAVSLGKRSYDIIIGRGVIDTAGKRICSVTGCRHAFVVSNKTVWRLHGKRLVAGFRSAGMSCDVRLVPDTEKSKSFFNAETLARWLASADSGKRYCVAALGGGVIGDLAGFAAAIFKRGVPYVQIPTTLLAQVDSAIGGKTGIDLPEGKNLVGAFHQPKLVLCDTFVLGTLPRRQIRNGLAEVIKYAAIADGRLFSLLRVNAGRIAGGDTARIIPVVSRCAAIKASVVSIDEFETRGVRTLLNFGHTFGHAIEAATGFTEYLHGEAVALGMIASALISVRLGRCSDICAAQLRGVIREAGLPVVLRKVSAARVMRYMARDKKFVPGSNRFVLLRGIGKAEVAASVPEEEIKEALKALQKG